jgi:uncharacterized protein (TIGR02265 family)
VQVVEGLLQHALHGKVSPRLRERLRTAGVDLDRPLLPLYPVPVWVRCLHLIVEEVYPSLPREEAFRQLARAHVEGYGRTLLGKAVLAMMRLLGPKRVAQRLPQVLGGTDNYTEATLTEVGPAHFELELNSNQDVPGYVEALLERMLEVGGAKAPRVTKLSAGEGRTRLSLTWSEEA